MATGKKAPKVPVDCLPCCGTCAYFVARGDGGDCIRYPRVPIVVADEPVSVYPVHAATDVCGEYRRKAH